jgi:hypothetical protein
VQAGKTERKVDQPQRIELLLQDSESRPAYGPPKSVTGEKGIKKPLAERTVSGSNTVISVPITALAPAVWMKPETISMATSGSTLTVWQPFTKVTP